MLAKISEIFLSYQGEGTFMGSRQAFLRFYGCNLSCAYCDTVQESYKSFSKEALLGKILDLSEDYNELVLTGGEPLIYADFLREFLKLYKKSSKKRVYLETNGTLPEEMAKICSLVDIVSMDFKLPSSTEITDDVWPLHEAFMRECLGKEIIVKAVITDDTDIEDIKKMAAILKDFDEDITVILQPVTEERDRIKTPDEEMLFFFKEYLRKETTRKTVVMGQMHKCMGIR